LSVLERAGFVAGKEPCAIREDALVLEPGGAHRCCIEREMQQLDMIDRVLALEVGDHRRGNAAGVEARRVVCRSRLTVCHPARGERTVSGGSR